MMETLTPLAMVTIAMLIGAVIGYYVRQSIARKRAGTIEAELQKKIVQTKQTTEEIVSKAKEKAGALEKKTYADLEERQKVLIRSENRILKKEEDFENKEKEIVVKEKEVVSKVEKLKEIKKDLDVLKEETLKKLEKISGLSKDQAKEELLAKAEREYQAEILDRVRKMEERGTEQYERKAKEILSNAIQSYALSQAQELTTSSVDIPSDEIKGRIIGKEGRNIRALKRRPAWN
ncbi:MAG: Rnase Y domain-containing protein [Candidatus Paceibacterota bacterium]